VKTGNTDVLATSFVKRGDGKGGRPGVLVALASWAREPVDVRLAIDWRKLGLDAKKTVLRAPAIDKFQDAADFKPGDSIRVEPGRGRLLVLR
jgi:hypothetical protein